MEFRALLIRVCPDSTFLFPLRASTASHCALHFYVEGICGHDHKWRPGSHSNGAQHDHYDWSCYPPWFYRSPRLLVVSNNRTVSNDRIVERYTRSSTLSAVRLAGSTVEPSIGGCSGHRDVFFDRHRPSNLARLGYDRRHPLSGSEPERRTNGSSPSSRICEGLAGYRRATPSAMVSCRYQHEGCTRRSVADGQAIGQ